MTKNLFGRLALLSVAGLVLAGCIGETTAPARDVNVAPLTYYFPNSEGFIQREDTLFPYMALPTMNQGVHDSNQRNQIFYENKNEDTFVVHRRRFHPAASAGIRYTVAYEERETENSFSVVFQPRSFDTYNETLIGSADSHPAFSVDELMDRLSSGQIHYRFEIDSQYNSEAVYANFVRLTTQNPFRGGRRDPVSGKIFQNEFFIVHRDAEVRFVVETFPYRDGSKAVISARIPAVMTSANTIDFTQLVNEIEQRLVDLIDA